MATTTSGSRPGIARLIFIPALISLAVTVLRVVGEIQHWSETWFSRSQRPGWPALFRTLLAYGLAARIPVVVVMFLAMRGQWGTHYDYFGLPPEFQMDFWPKYLWLGFVPQLTFWVGFTIVVGSLSGIIATAAERLQLKKEKSS